MPIFTYSGRTRDGMKISGELEDATKEAVARALQRKGTIPISISETKTHKKANDHKSTTNAKEQKETKKLKTDELIFFSRQMYALTKSSVPLMDALDGLYSTTDNKNLATIIRNLSRGLDKGLSLTGAMESQPKIFTDLYINLIRVGETTGNLSEIFDAIAHYLQKEKDIKEKVKNALRYPMTVLIVIAIGLVVVNTFVLPAFTLMYNSFNAELPLPTRILLGFSEFTQSYGFYIVAAIAAAILGIRYYLNTPEGKFKWHEKQFTLPLVGNLLKQNSVSRFARTFAITNRAGVPMEQSLRIIGPAIGNVYMEKKVAKMREEVERGESVAHAVTHSGVFPGIVIQMVSVGENAGTLDEMVAEVADYYEREIDQSVKVLSSAIEPIIIAFIAVIVLILALGVFLPMISLLGAIK